MENQVYQAFLLQKNLKRFGFASIILMAFFLLICVLTLKAKAHENVVQETTISGTVTDQQGEPIPGVTVVVSGTTVGTTTDTEGQYSLTIPSDIDAEYLTFSFVGMQEQNVPIDEQTTIDVTMEEGTYELDDVVVIGYGTQQRANVIGSVTSVTSEDLNDAPVSNVSNALTGRLPGGIFMQEEGEPGADEAIIRVRGNSTLNNNNPLVVIDGIPGRNLNSLNPSDIESVTVLKDASAAIYGARAANGVILVTTKRGETDAPPTLTYQFSRGALSPTKLPEMADAATYATMINEMQSYRGIDPEDRAYDQEDIDKYESGDFPWTHPNTDWFDEALRDYSTTQRQNLSISGGTQSIRYFTSFGSQSDDGIFTNNSTSYDRYNLRANIDVQVNEYIDVGLDVTGTQENRMYPTKSAGENFRAAIRNYPTTPALWPSGHPGPDIEYGDQPMVSASDETGFDDDKRVRTNNILTARLKMPGVEGLELSSYFGYDTYTQERKLFQKPWTLYDLDEDAYLAAGNTGSEDGSEFLVGTEKAHPEPRVTNYNEQSTSQTLNIKLDYVTSFGEDHNLSAFAAYEHNKFDEEGVSAFRRYLLSTELPYLFAGGDEEKDNSNWVGLDASQNYFGRISYDYQETYLFQFSFRRDGSIRFAEDRRWGNFPSVLLGWVPSQHDWWENNLDFIDYFKLRASYGQLGNDRVDPFQYLTSYGFDTGYTLGSDKVYTSGLNQANAPNPNITWEISNNYNVGWEAHFLDSRLNFETDIFYEKRSDILVERNVSVPRFTGITLPDENYGIVNNYGFETTLGFRDIKGDIRYGFTGNVAFARNKIVEYDEPERSVEWQRRTGKPMGAVLRYRSLGIFRDWDHVDSYPHVSGARPGDIIIEDYDGDGEITTDDRVLFTETATPEVTFGLSFDLGFKNWDLRGLIQGHSNTSRDIFNDNRIGTAGNYFQWDAEDRWTPDNQDASKPRAFERAEEYWRSSHRTDYHLIDNSYVRLRNLQLTYSIPQDILTRISASNLSIYVAGQNLFLLRSGNDIMDPENWGMGAYPIMRTLTMGAEISF